MTVQISDEQLGRLAEARSALSIVISRNKYRWVDIELADIRAALDDVLRSEENQSPAVINSTGL